MISAWGIEHGDDVSKGLGSALKGIRSGQLARAGQRGVNAGSKAAGGGAQTITKPGIAVTRRGRDAYSRGVGQGHRIGLRQHALATAPPPSGRDFSAPRTTFGPPKSLVSRNMDAENKAYRTRHDPIHRAVAQSTRRKDWWED